MAGKVSFPSHVLRLQSLLTAVCVSACHLAHLSAGAMQGEDLQTLHNSPPSVIQPVFLNDGVTFYRAALRRWSRAACQSSSRGIDAVVRRHVPDARLLSCAGGEIAFRLPKTDAAKCAQSGISDHQRAVHHSSCSRRQWFLHAAPVGLGRRRPYWTAALLPWSWPDSCSSGDNEGRDAASDPTYTNVGWVSWLSSAANPGNRVCHGLSQILTLASYL